MPLRAIGDFAAPKPCASGLMLLRVAEGQTPYHCVKPSGMGESGLLTTMRVGCDPSSASCVGPAAPAPPPFLGPNQTPDQVIAAAAAQAAADAQAQAAAQSSSTGWTDRLAAWVDSFSANSGGSAPATTAPWWLWPAAIIGGLVFVASAGVGFGGRR